MTFHVFSFWGCYMERNSLNPVSGTVMLHIGSLIKAEFDKQPRSHTVAWFARQLNCNRGNIYDIFGRATIDTQLLMRISQILAHDFFSDLSQYCREGMMKGRDGSGVW